MIKKFNFKKLNESKESEKSELEIMDGTTAYITVDKLDIVPSYLAQIEDNEEIGQVVINYNDCELDGSELDNLKNEITATFGGYSCYTISVNNEGIGIFFML